MNSTTNITDESEPLERSNKMRAVKRILAFAVIVGAIVLLLFIYNGTSDSWHQPRFVVGEDGAQVEEVGQAKIMAYNIAKCFAYTGVTSFASSDEVKARLDEIAQLIKVENPDLVFLSEVVNECGPCPVDQVAYLAKKCGFPCWASSDNYSWGLPFYRIRSGNGILSRFPLSDFETTELKGESTIWNPTNNRRVLWCKVEINGEKILAGSLRNDSFDLENNHDQVDQILDFVGNQPTILAGDFNAEPHNQSMKKFAASKLFSGAFKGEKTYPTRKPWRRIDYVLAPKPWTLISDQVIQSKISDHLPVLATFSLPK